MKRPRGDTRSDFDRVKEALHETKAEIRKLKKENAALRKQLSRADTIEVEKRTVYEEELSQQFEPLKVKEPPSNKCPKCHSENFKNIEAGKYLISVCNDCRFKSRKTLKDF